MVIDIVKVILPASLAFIFGIGIAPILSHYLYTFKAWKKKGGKRAFDGKEAVIFNSLHEEKEVGTPRMGGIVIWGSVALTVIFLWFLGLFAPTETTLKLDFLSRSQTWLPFFGLMVGAIVGFLDDYLEIRGSTDYQAGGLSLTKRLAVVFATALFVGWWFYEKLDVSTISVPFFGDLFLGWLIVPFFVFLTLVLYTSGVIDGIDGLSGGVFASVFAGYAAIAFYQQQIDLAAFSATILGGILAFLWFNIPPARFYMTETGTMGLTLALAIIVFMTDSLGGGHGIAVLPIIGFLLVVTALSSVLQIFWKKAFKRKLLPMALLHHYFESIGWPGYKVTMRYWILGIMFAFFGVLVALVG